MSQIGIEQILKPLKGKPVDVQREALIQAIQAEFKGSLFKTAKYLLGYKDITYNTHGEMIDALQADTKRKLIVMPRGALKSSLGIVAYSIWLLIRDPNERILIDSETYGNSKNFIREIKGHLESPLITQVFGTFRSDSNWAESSITIAQRTKVLKEASITASGIGANKTGQHYSAVLHDDVNTDRNSQSPENCAKVLNHYRLNTSILDPGGIMAVIGTRYSEADLIQNIIDNELSDEQRSQINPSHRRRKLGNSERA